MVQETKVTETTEAVAFAFDKMEQYFTAAQEAISKYGADTVDLGLNALRVDAAAAILPGILCAVVFGALCFMAAKRISLRNLTKDQVASIIRKSYSMRSSEEDAIVGAYCESSSSTSLPEEWESTEVKSVLVFTERNVIFGVCAALSGGLAIIGVTEMVNLWAWVGLFYPELYAVHKFIL